MPHNTDQEQLAVAPPANQPAIGYSARRIYWGATIAGVIVTVGIWLLLHVLGLGIGLATVDPQYPTSLRGVGIGTGIWSVIAPILALFVGGMVAGRVAGAIPPLSAVIHGTVLWSIATLGSLIILLWVLGSLIGGAAQVGGQVLGATGSAAVQGIAQLDQVTLENLGLTEEDFVAPINQRLEAQGKPTVTADQLQAAMRDALSTAVREGRFDRALLVSSLAQNTPLSEEDAQEVAATIEQRWQERGMAITQRAQELGQRAQQTAFQAIETTGGALVWSFFLMLLGLGSAIGGSFLATRRQRRNHVVVAHAG